MLVSKYFQFLVSNNLIFKIKFNDLLIKLTPICISNNCRKQSLHVSPVPLDLRDSSPTEDTLGSGLRTQCHGHPMDATAQIEAIVSNMGASKQGHYFLSIL